MSFHFQREESIEHAVRRIARAQIDGIVADLTGRRRVSRDKAIHESRKRLKRLRALLRLLRDGMGRAVRRRENETFRDAGRWLSASRDAKVLVDAFDGLVGHFKGQTEAARFAPMRVTLLSRRRAAQREQTKRGVGEPVPALRASRQALDKLTLKRKGFAALRGGLKHTFCEGRRAFDVAIYDRHPARLHEWRKRVKDLWHQIELLTPIWPDVLDQLAEKIHTLADCLGEDHDLAVLRQALIDDHSSQREGDVLETLLALIDARRRELQQAAMQLGLRVYGEKPSLFIERMENYWNAWRAGEGAEKGDH